MADARANSFNRSNTVSSDKKRASFHKQPSIPPHAGTQYFSPGDRRFSGGETSWSPLKKFGQAKEKISKAFRRLAEQLNESKTFLGEINSPRFDDAGQLQLKVKGIQDILVRDHMKVVFFGRTSNGKSTAINALLHDKVLPTGIGHTTNCFCSVVGTDAKEGYLLLSDSEEKQSVESVQQLAHSLSADQLDSSSLVSVYWPKDKCDLLSEDVVLVDSPGIDMDPDIDKWINTHCLDADVFVLVSNAESTLMQSEKKFFHRVSERLSKPNIFILNNRWDMSESDTDREMVEKVKSQHLRFASDFLVNGLKVANDTTCKDRVFFVSAKEVLSLREAKAKGRPTDGTVLSLVLSLSTGLLLANNWQQRLVDFDTFERKLKECLSSAAIHTKFEKHHQEGQRALKALQDTMKQAEEECVTRNNEVNDKLQEVDQSERKIKEEEKRLEKDTQLRIAEAETVLDRRIAAVVNDTNLQLSAIVKGYGEVFNPAHIEPYLQALCISVDSEVFNEGSKKYIKELTELQCKVSVEMAGDFQKALGLSKEEIKRLVASTNFSGITFFPSCVEVCKDFSPDLSFHFSLGLTSLLDKWNVAPSFVGAIISVTTNQYLLLGGALGFGYLISRLVTWEVVLSVGIVFGLLYGYERLTWTDSAKERSFKDQFKAHVSEKMKKHVNESKTSYHGMLTNDLKLQMSRWMEQVNVKKLSLRENSAGLLKQSKLLMAWSQKASKLRNALLIVGRDFDDFEERYLPASSDEEVEQQVVTQVFS